MLDGMMSPSEKEKLMSLSNNTLYIWLAIIVWAGIIICVLILRKQKQDREKQKSADDRKQETPAVRSSSVQTHEAKGAAASPSADQIDLNAVLDREELRLLATDLSCLADKLQAQGVGIEEINVVRVVSELVSRTGCIPKQALNLCVLATQDMVDSVASTFGLSMGGHNALLEKLKKLQDEFG